MSAVSVVVIIRSGIRNSAHAAFKIILKIRVRDINAGVNNGYFNGVAYGNRPNQIRVNPINSPGQSFNRLGKLLA